MGQLATIKLAAAAPKAASGATLLASGAAAQQLFAAGEVQNGFVVANGNTAADQGSIAAAEEIWIDLTGNAAVAAANSSSISIQPGQSFTFTGQCFNSVSWIAATTNHTISAFSY